MSHDSQKTRREFLSRTATGAIAIGAVGGTQLFASPKSTSKKRVPEMKVLLKTKASKARKIATGPDNKIYIAADRSILVYGANGKALQTISLSRPARSLAVKNNGDILVGIFDHVEIFASNGKKIAIWKSPQAGAIIAGIAVDSKEQIFIADAGLGKVWKYSSQGEKLSEIQSNKTLNAPAEFFSIAIDSQDNLVINNPSRHRVETFSNAGKNLKTWGEKSRKISGFSGCCNPVSLASLPNGKIITAERGQPRIKMYSPEGKFESLVAGPELFKSNAKASAFDQKQGCQTGGIDLAVNSSQELLVLDRVTGIVHKYA